MTTEHKHSAAVRSVPCFSVAASLRRAIPHVCVVMQPPPTHLPAAYNGQAGAGWPNSSELGVRQQPPFQSGGGRGGRRGRGGQQRQSHPYPPQQHHHHDGQAQSQHSGRRGGRGRGAGSGRGTGRGGGRGAEGAMNQVWYKPSFLDDPWAALEGRPAGPILLTGGASHATSSDTHNSSRATSLLDDREARSTLAAAPAINTQPSDADSSSVPDRPSLVLPPPHYS